MFHRVGKIQEIFGALIIAFLDTEWDRKMLGGTEIIKL